MIWFVFLLATAALAAPFAIERMRPAIGAGMRSNAPGQFAKLPSGVTHYQWHGPDGGPVLICVHGLTTPSYVWNALLPGLTAAGFRVLTYDLFGRGHSDRPRGAQNRAFFVGQLRELLQDQGVDRPVTLMGYSMGGSVATAFAVEEPDRVARLVLLAPAGMIHAPGLLAQISRKTPLIGDWLHLAFAGPRLIRYAREQDGPADLVADLARRQWVENGRRGYLPAVLSSQRNLLGKPLESDHRTLAKSTLSVAAIWGAADTVIPIASMACLAQWNPRAHQVVISGAGHGLAYTHPSQVLEALAQVLKD